MPMRKRRGSTLTLVVTAILLIAIIGVAIDFLLMVFKQNRVSMNTNDSITLGVARDAIRAPRIALQDGVEKQLFSKVLKDDFVDLGSYNNLVAPVVLVAANAAADGSPESVAYANKVIDVLQAPAPPEVLRGEVPPSSNMSIAARLTYALNKAARDYSQGGYLQVSRAPSPSLFSGAIAGNDVRFGTPSGSGGGASADAAGDFKSVAPTSSSGYLSRAGGESVPGKSDLIKDMSAWMESGGPSNIAIDTFSLPYVINKRPPERIELNVSTVNHKGKYYLPGYVEIKFSGGASSQIKPIMAFTFPEGEQPHLVSSKQYADSKRPDFLGRLCVPPNAVKFVSASKDQKGSTHFCAAEGQVGCIKDPKMLAPMVLPPWVAYIEIANMGDIAYYNYNGTASQTTNVFAKELMEGIWLADNGAFSTNKQVLIDWARYNNGLSTVKPPLRDSNNNLIVHGNVGTIHGLKPQSSGSRANGPCMWLNVTHGDPDYYDSQCGDQLPAFEEAYPPGVLQPATPTNLMAVEQFKQTIRTAFNTCGNFGCPAQSTGLRIYTDGWPGMAPDGVPDGRPARAMVNPVPEGANSKISRAGSIVELLEQVDPENAPTVLMELEQRMRQVDFKASDQKVYDILHNRKIELGEVLFILKTEDGIAITNERPYEVRGVTLDASYLNNPDRKPIGQQQIYSSEYGTIGTLVNPQREQDIHLQLYTSYPDADHVGRGVDIAEWTAGGGTKCLGRLRFKNQCAGTNTSGAAMEAAGEFCQPD